MRILFGWVRSLYDWVLHKSEHRCAPVFLSTVAFTESWVFPIPPDIMLIPMCLGARGRSFWFATLCTLSSVLGGILGYYIGAFLYQTVGIHIIEFYHLEATFERLKELFANYGVWFVIVAGWTPIPYKVFTIASGAVSMAFAPFVIASILSRGARFYLVSGLVYWLGPKAEQFIDRHFNVLTIIFAILLIGFMVAVKYI